MTDARLGGLGREALVSSTGQARLGGLAREALISGQGLTGRITGRSSARGDLTITAAGVTLSSTARSVSSVRGGATISIALAGRVTGTSRISLAQLPDDVPLAGRIEARSSAQLAELAIQSITAMAKAISQARAAPLTISTAGPQNAVTLNVG